MITCLAVRTSDGSAWRQRVRVIKMLYSRLPSPIKQPHPQALLCLRHRPEEGPPWNPPRGSGAPAEQQLLSACRGPASLGREASKLLLELGGIAGRKSHVIALHPRGSAASRSINESRVQKPLLYVIQESGHCSYTADEIYRNAGANKRGAHLHKSFNSKVQLGRWLLTRNSAPFAARRVHVGLPLRLQAGVCRAGGRELRVSAPSVRSVT